MVKSALSKPPAFVVVCPYEGGGAELDWRRSWRAEFVAHTGIEDPKYQNPALEELAVASRVLPDKIDLAILRHVAPVAGTPLAKPPPLRFSKKTLVAGQQCWVLGYPRAGSSTPTLVPVTFSFMDGNALKVTGAQIMPGHSGGPLVTRSGTVAGWNFSRNDELSHCRPIAAAEKCIGLVLPAPDAWEQLLASPEAEDAHDRQQQHAADARTAAGFRRAAELLEADDKRPKAASSSDSDLEGAATVSRGEKRKAALLEAEAHAGPRGPVDAATEQAIKNALKSLSASISEGGSWSVPLHLPTLFLRERCNLTSVNLDSGDITSILKVLTPKIERLVMDIHPQAEVDDFGVEDPHGEWMNSLKLALTYQGDRGKLKTYNDLPLSPEEVVRSAARSLVRQQKDSATVYFSNYHVNSLEGMYGMIGFTKLVQKISKEKQLGFDLVCDSMITNPYEEPDLPEHRRLLYYKVSRKKQ